ncbi:Mfa1 family fimbria major subunit [Parabacteroides sp. OttesenSCG-928-J18]|nr:Mfa1 family fimbria major subunit [Parabacteroides sp. OttesenSCG-928-J18]
MKTNFFKRAAMMLLAAGTILTTACSDNVPGGEDDKNNPTGEVGYVSFSLINSSLRGTKAAPTGTTNYGTAAENTVNTVLILLYNTDSGSEVVKYRFHLTSIGTPSAPGTDMVSIVPTYDATTYRTKAQAVAKADYKLVVLVNPPAVLTANTTSNAITGSGQPLSAIQDFASVAVTDLTGTASGNNPPANFLMSNFAGLKDVKEADIKPTAAEAQVDGAPVALYVERAVAKVTLAKKADNFSAMTDVAVGDITWNVDIVNKKTYWMRKPANMLNPSASQFPLVLTTQTGNLIPEKVTEGETSDYDYALPQYRYLMYATDPNMSVTGTDGAVDTNNYTLATAATLAMDASAYVTENTMDATAQYENITTSVLISAMITPAKTYFEVELSAGTPAGDGTDAVPSDEYFLFNNNVFNRQDIQDLFAVGQAATEAAANAVVITNAKKESSGSYTWGELMAAGNAEISSLPAILKAIASTTTEGVTTVDTDYFTSSEGKLTASRDMASGSAIVRFFAADAPNYYYVPIRHFGDDLQKDDMTYGRYGVVRNNWYKLTLNGINKYGTATIPTVRKDPDDKGNAWLSVQFEILPWMVRSQGIDL